MSGTWSGGTSGGASCTTNASGQCDLISERASRSSAVSFSVTEVTGDGLTYDSTANHDPDGDSDGTSITIAAP